MKGLFGTCISAGRVSIDGEQVDIQKPAHAIRAGMMLCPEDRKAEGIIPVHWCVTTSIFPPAVSLFARVA